MRIEARDIFRFGVSSWRVHQEFKSREKMEYTFRLLNGEKSDNVEYRIVEIK